jgi:hypothetical protein
MVWTYLTEITPYNVGQETSEQKKRSANHKKAFNSFLEECCIPEDKLLRSINYLKRNINNRTKRPNNKYRIFMDLDSENNELVIEEFKYFKSKFLSSNMFRNALINYYKPLGLFVRGPHNITTKDGLYTTKWTIDLYWKREEGRSEY